MRSTVSTLLVTEMDDQFRRSLTERLRLDGYKVLEACDETEMKRFLHTKAIDVILIGLGGFGGRGIAMLKFTKELRPLTEVILLTPSEDHSLALSMEGMRLGAFDDILTPFDLDTLMDRLREACEQKKKNVEVKRSRVVGSGERTPDGI